MAYPTPNFNQPDSTTQSPAEYDDSIRYNINFLRDVLALGGIFIHGWDSEAVSALSDYEQPDYWLASNGVQRIKVTPTWGTTGGQAGNIIQIYGEYSSNSGSTWDFIVGPENKPYLQITWTADSLFRQAIWSATPL